MNITSLEQLIKEFDDAEPSKRVSILKRIDIPIASFEDFSSWEQDDYTRNCIYRNDDFELILLCWDVDTKTPIHGHAGQDCWVYQVSGEVKELRYDKSINGSLRVTNNMKFKEGMLAYMHDRMGFHSIENIGSSRAMTLHIYASPIDRCRIYEPEKGLFVMKELEYDTIEGNAIKHTGS